MLLTKNLLLGIKNEMWSLTTWNKVVSYEMKKGEGGSCDHFCHVSVAKKQFVRNGKTLGRSYDPPHLEIKKNPYGIDLNTGEAGYRYVLYPSISRPPFFLQNVAGCYILERLSVQGKYVAWYIRLQNVAPCYILEMSVGTSRM